RTAPNSLGGSPHGRAQWRDASCPRRGGLSSSSASPCATQRQHANSRIWRGSSEGWAAKSKPSKSRAQGKWAIFIAISIRRSSLRAISRSRSNASAEATIAKILDRQRAIEKRQDKLEL